MNPKAFNRFFYSSLAVLAIIYWMGMHLTLMDVDSSTYALLSKQMFQSGHYLELYLNGKDYLDKPPLVFWSACLLTNYSGYTIGLTGYHQCSAWHWVFIPRIGMLVFFIRNKRLKWLH